MEHSRELILQAEEQIQQFADQLSRAKRVVDEVETVEKLLRDAAQRVSVACEALEHTQQQINAHFEQQGRQIQDIAQELANQTSSAIALMVRLKDETIQALQTVGMQLGSIEQAIAKQTKILYLIVALLVVVLIVSVLALVLP